jgi:hypothetical protein
MNSSYSLLPLFVLAVAAIITVLLVLILNKKKNSNEENTMVANPENEDVLNPTLQPGNVKSVFKLTLKYIGYNLLAGLLLSSPLLLLMKGKDDFLFSWLFVMLAAGPLSIFIQLIIGIVWAAGNKKKEMGKALLLTVGLFLLIGLFTCSPFLLRSF